MYKDRLRVFMWQLQMRCRALVAQGRTVSETIDIARDVVRKLMESQENLNLPEVQEEFDYPLIVE
jgi:hypothetical protein